MGQPKCDPCATICTPSPDDYTTPFGVKIPICKNEKYPRQKYLPTQNALRIYEHFKATKPSLGQVVIGGQDVDFWGKDVVDFLKEFQPCPENRFFKDKICNVRKIQLLSVEGGHKGGLLWTLPSDPYGKKILLEKIKKSCSGVEEEKESFKKKCEAIIQAVEAEIEREKKKVKTSLAKGHSKAGKAGKEEKEKCDPCEKSCIPKKEDDSNTFGGTKKPQCDEGGVNFLFEDTADEIFELVRSKCNTLHGQMEVSAPNFPFWGKDIVGILKTNFPCPDVRQYKDKFQGKVCHVNKVKLSDKFGNICLTTYGPKELNEGLLKKLQKTCVTEALKDSEGASEKCMALISGVENYIKRQGNGDDAGTLHKHGAIIAAWFAGMSALVGGGVYLGKHLITRKKRADENAKAEKIDEQAERVREAETKKMEAEARMFDSQKLAQEAAADVAKAEAERIRAEADVTKAQAEAIRAGRPPGEVSKPARSDDVIDVEFTDAAAESPKAPKSGKGKGSGDSTARMDITFGAYSMIESVLPENAKAAMRKTVTAAKPAIRGIGIAGLAFYIGDLVSEVIVNGTDSIENITLDDVARDVAALAGGGGIGKLTVDRVFAMRGMSKAPTAIKGVFGRAFPLFTALTFLELARTGEVDWEELPKTAAKVLGVSTVVHGTLSVAKGSSTVSKVLKGAKILNKVGKSTIIGAGLTTIAEFTILKWLGDLEVASYWTRLETDARMQIADAISADYHILKSIADGEQVEVEKVREVERELLYVAQLPSAIVEAKVDYVKSIHIKERRELYDEYLADVGYYREKGKETSKLVKEYEAERSELNHKIIKKKTKLRDDSKVHPQDLPLLQYMDDPDWVLLSKLAAEENSEPIDIDESVYPECDGVKEISSEYLSYNLHGMKKQMQQYLEDRNKLFQKFIEDRQAGAQLVAGAKR